MARKQKAIIPIAKGLAQDIDARIRPPDRMAEVTNGWLDKTGSVRKRHGFTAVHNEMAEDETVTPGTLGDVRGMFSTGKELCIIGSKRLYARVDEHDRWYTRGFLSPCTAKSSGIFSGARVCMCSDSAAVDGYVFSATSYLQQSGTVYTFALELVAQDEGGDVVMRDRQVEVSTDVSSNVPFGPKCLALTNGEVVIAYGYHDDLSVPDDGQVRVLVWDSADPPTTPSAPHVGVSPVVLNSFSFSRYTTAHEYQIRTHDLARCETDSAGTDGYVVFYITSSNVLSLVIYDNSHSVIDTDTSFADLNNVWRVAVCEGESSEFVYALYVSDDQQETPVRQIRLLKYNTAQVALVWDELVYTLEFTSSNGEMADNLGVAVGAVESGSVRAECIWTISSYPAAGGGGAGEPHTRSMCVSTNTSGSDLSTVTEIPNSITQAGPFWQNGRAYAVFHIGPPNHPGNFAYQGWGAAVLVDLAVDEGETPFSEAFSLVGLWDVGLVPLLCPNLAAYTRISNELGNCNRIDSLDTGNRFTLSTHYLTLYSNELDADGVTYVGTPTAPLIGVKQIELDFDEVPVAVPLLDSGALIGGAMVTYYSGADDAFELGFPVSPMPFDATEVGSSSNYNGALGDTWYFGTYEHYDNAGVLHRGPPSPRVLIDLTGSSADSIDVEFHTFCPSNRNPALTNIVGYVVRAAQGADSARLGLVIQNHANLQSANLITINENGLDSSLPVYTTGGVVEAIAPMGARIPMVGLERVFLLGMVRGDLLQYSKAFTSVGGTPVAPEFNEGFAKPAPNGERFTGGGELDDKIIAFTENAVYVLVGSGPTETGANDDFSALTQVSNDAGCIEARSVVSFPGGLLFQSKAGIYSLSRGLSLEYVGKAVEDELATYPVVTSAVLVAKDTHVRFTVTNAAGDDGAVLVFDYESGEWSKWVPRDANGDPIVAVGAAEHAGTYYITDAAANVYKHDTTTWWDAAQSWVPLDVRLGWFQGAGLSGWQRVCDVLLLAARKSPHDLTVELYHDFDSATVVSSRTWTAAQIAAMAAPDVRMQLEMNVRRPKCTSFMVRVYDSDPEQASSGEGFDLAGFTVYYKPKPGSARLADGQRT